jgi:hypothetical protein
MSADDWNIFGLVLQVAGAALAARGLWQTWHEYAPEGERFLQPLMDGMVRLVRWSRRRLAPIESTVRRALRRPLQVTANAQAALASGSALDARATIAYAALPTDDLRTTVTALDARTHELLTMITRVEGTLGERVDDMSERTDSLASRVDLLEDDVGERIRTVAVGGVRKAAAGLLLVLAGMLMQLWAAI